MYNSIGKKFNIILSLIPIGAFEPRWFMQSVHMDPAEAVLVHQHLKSKFSIASHFQTFPLAGDNYTQAAQELAVALKNNKIPTEEFITPNPGEVYWFNFN